MKATSKLFKRLWDIPTLAQQWIFTPKQPERKSKNLLLTWKARLKSVDVNLGKSIGKTSPQLTETFKKFRKKFRKNDSKSVTTSNYI